MRRTAIALALLIVPVLALSGCTPTPPPAVTAPKPSSTPLFATEDEALKAATEAYAAYLKVADVILSDGGANPERIDSVASGDAREAFIESAEAFASKTYHAVGRSTFRGAEIEQLSAQGTSTEVSAYLCLEVGGIDVLDASGASVVSATRPPTQAMEITVLYERDKPMLTTESAISDQSTCM